MPKQDKTFVRTGAGEIWVDDSLKDWPENDYRIFVGDLGKETTTEMLAKIFQPYKSFAKAKVLHNSISYIELFHLTQKYIWMITFQAFFTHSFADASVVR